MMFGASFHGNRPGHFLHERGVESASQSDGLRKDGGASGAGDPVERLVPPVHGGNPQTRNRGGLVQKLRDFLFDRHRFQKESYSIFERERGLEPFEFLFHSPSSFVFFDVNIDDFFRKTLTKSPKKGNISPF
ncbi:hypothetical protein SDC9_204610 [bioreactor metagenome]|uniref:Uncharacterized protein n=1 Tax=bioreactor metagenome TaxID=1076179 RepID=A0A645J0I6_9ZZZZ